MNRVFVSLFFACGLFVPSLLAQMPSPGRPKAPFFDAPPPGSRWEVSIKVHKAGNETKAAENVAVNITDPAKLTMSLGMNGVARGVITYADGSTKEYLVSNGMIFRRYANSKEIDATPAAVLAGEFNSLLVANYPALSWLAADCFVGIETIDEVPYYHFRLTAMPDVIWTGKVEAWIRVQDRKPFRVVVEQEGDRTFEYLFSETSVFPETIELPPEYRAVVDGIKKRREALELMKKLNRGS